MTGFKPTGQEVLDALIEKEGLTEYIRDYYSARNGKLKILYAQKDFYIAEDRLYQPWLTVMGQIPPRADEEQLYARLLAYCKDPEYKAVCTNMEKVSDFLEKTGAFSYHEDFYIARLAGGKVPASNGIRPAGEEDLPFIEATYKRSGHEQLQNRIHQNQMWVWEEKGRIKGYAGMHKDCSLGFEYVAPDCRRQGVASGLQAYIANRMMAEGLQPYVMISKENETAKRLQTKLHGEFAKKLLYFYAKGAYEYE